jgi:hypothetical protein
MKILRFAVLALFSAMLAICGAVGASEVGAVQCEPSPMPSQGMLVEVGSLAPPHAVRLYELTTNTRIANIRAKLGSNAEVALEELRALQETGLLDAYQGTLHAFARSAGELHHVSLWHTQDGWHSSNQALDPDYVVRVWSSGARCPRRTFFLVPAQ